MDVCARVWLVVCMALASLLSPLLLSAPTPVTPSPPLCAEGVVDGHCHAPPAGQAEVVW